MIPLISPHLISLIFYSKCTQEKTLVPIIMSFQKVTQKLRDLLGSKNPTKQKFTLNTAPNYLREKIGVNREKTEGLS